MKNREVVVRMIHGSHLYGLAGEGSDVDYKSIVLPSLDDLLLGNTNFTVTTSTGTDDGKNGEDDIDNQTFSLKTFMRMAAKGEMIAMDMLHAPDNMIIESSDIWEELRGIRSLFYTRDMKAYMGYVRKQAAKYGVKGTRMGVVKDVIVVMDNMCSPSTDKETLLESLRLTTLKYSLPITNHSRWITEDTPTGEQTFYELLGKKYQSTLKLRMFYSQIKEVYDKYGERARLAEKNEGVDWKAVSHAVRAGYQLYHIYKDGDFSYPLPETDLIRKVKYGEMDFVTEVQPLLEELVKEVEDLADKSDYVDKVSDKVINNYVKEKHLEMIRGELL